METSAVLVGALATIVSAAPASASSEHETRDTAALPGAGGLLGGAGGLFGGNNGLLGNPLGGLGSALGGSIPPAIPTAIPGSLTDQLNGFVFNHLDLSYVASINPLDLNRLEKLAVNNHLDVVSFKPLFNSPSFDINSLLKLQQLSTLLAIASTGLLDHFDLSTLPLGGLNLGLLGNLKGLNLGSLVDPNLVPQILPVAKPLTNPKAPSLLDPLAGLLRPPVAGLANALKPVLDPVSGLLKPVTSPLKPVTGGLVDPIAKALGLDPLTKALGL